MPRWRSLVASSRGAVNPWLAATNTGRRHLAMPGRLIHLPGCAERGARRLVRPVGFSAQARGAERRHRSLRVCRRARRQRLAPGFALAGTAPLRRYRLEPLQTPMCWSFEIIDTSRRPRRALALTLSQLILQCANCRRTCKADIAGCPARIADLGETVLGGSPADFAKPIAEETEKKRSEKCHERTLALQQSRDDSTGANLPTTAAGQALFNDLVSAGRAENRFPSGLFL
jgi:hypothetical protein